MSRKGGATKNEFGFGVLLRRQAAALRRNETSCHCVSGTRRFVVLLDRKERRVRDGQIEASASNARSGPEVAAFLSFLRSPAASGTGERLKL